MITSANNTQVKNIIQLNQKAKARRAEQKARDQRAHDLRHLKLLRNEAQNLRAQQDQRKIQQKVIRHIDLLPNSLISIQILPFHFARLYSNFFFSFFNSQNHQGNGRIPAQLRQNAIYLSFLT